MEANGHRVVADAQMFGDLLVVEARAIAQRQDLLVWLAQGLSAVEQALDPFLLDDPLLERRNVGDEVGNSIERDVK